MRKCRKQKTEDAKYRRSRKRWRNWWIAHRETTRVGDGLNAWLPEPHKTEDFFGLFYNEVELFK